MRAQSNCPLANLAFTVHTNYGIFSGELRIILDPHNMFNSTSKSRVQLGNNDISHFSMNEDLKTCSCFHMLHNLLLTNVQLIITEEDLTKFLTGES